ncbi:MAG: ATP-binding protein [Candidatus Diapherotrites archaeon]
MFESIDFTVLTQFNPWWVKGVVPEAFLGLRKRPVFGLLKSYLDKRFIVLVYGLRRVGKTTVFYQLIQHLIDSKFNSDNILYFSFDEKSASIEGVVSAFEEKVLRKRIADAGKVFVFFDEIQKVRDWESKIKILYDLNPNLKIFLSGSASVSLKRKSSESLAGRMIEFFVKPLSFAEFLEWKNMKIDLAKPEIFSREAMPLLMDYLRKGGFPEIVFEKSDEVIKNYMKNAVLEKIVYKDIPEEFSLKDLDLLKTLLELFIKEPGMILNIDRLSKDLGKSKITISNYIEYLFYGLVIKEVKNLRGNLLVSSRKGKKIYPSSTAFCFALLPDFFSDRIMEKIFEVAVAECISAENYYRNAFEIDFVKKKESGKIFPIEVKHGKIEKKQLVSFMKKFNAEKGLIVSQKEFSAEKEGIIIQPLWFFLLAQEQN